MVRDEMTHSCSEKTGEARYATTVLAHSRPCAWCRRVAVATARRHRLYLLTDQYVIVEDPHLSTPLLMARQHGGVAGGVHVVQALRDIGAVARGVYGEAYRLEVSPAGAEHFFVRAVGL